MIINKHLVMQSTHEIAKVTNRPRHPFSQRFSRIVKKHTLFPQKRHFAYPK